MGGIFGRERHCDRGREEGGEGREGVGRKREEAEAERERPSERRSVRPDKQAISHECGRRLGCSRPPFVPFVDETGSLHSEDSSETHYSAAMALYRVTC